jgi:methionyl-tRNA synthetase
MTDINLDLNDFRDKVNNELVANIANFVYRVLSFTNKNFDSGLGKISDKPILEEVAAETEKVRQSYANHETREALRGILRIGIIGNKYFQDKQPWKLIKEDKAAALGVVTTAANIVKVILILIKPILPEFSLKLEKQLGIDDVDFSHLSNFLENHKIGTAEIVYEKIDEIKLGQSQFARLNLKVARVDEIKEHPEADKLYVLQINLGSEKRQLVAGLRPYLKKEELLGKNIIVITNLKHHNFKGFVSEGMLLAAQVGDIIRPLEAPKSQLGSAVLIDGVEKGFENTITLDDFKTITITTKSGKVVFEDKILKTKEEEITTDMADNAVIR